MALIVVIQNVSSLAPVSDYDYRVLVGDGTPERSHTIASGKILAHTRDDGWKALVQRVLDESKTVDPVLEAAIAAGSPSRHATDEEVREAGERVIKRHRKSLERLADR